MRPRLVLFLLAFLAPPVFAPPVLAQSEADPADGASIDALLDAVYAVISGPADQDRDWDRFRALFAKGARLVPTRANADGGYDPVPMTPDDFATQSARTMREAPIFQGKGFYEVEAARRVERYGSIAHVWSTYESRLDPSEPPFMRGINSIQLIHDGTRWWILTIFWQHESPEVPLPDAYLID